MPNAFPRERIKRLLGDAGAAFLIGAIIALVLASLAAAGVITMILAVILLLVAWLIAVTVIYLSDPEWLPAGKPRYVFLGILGAIFIVVGIFEWAFFEPPLNARDIAREVVKNLPVPSTKLDTIPKRNLKPPMQENAKTDYAGRVVVDTTVEQLYRIYTDHTQLQAEDIAATYIGKWIKISGQVYDIEESIRSDRSYKVSIKRPPPIHLVYLSFDQTKKSQLALFGRDQQLSAICQIDKIEPSRVRFSNCDLLGVPTQN